MRDMKKFHTYLREVISWLVYSVAYTNYRANCILFLVENWYNQFAPVNHSCILQRQVKTLDWDKKVCFIPWIFFHLKWSKYENNNFFNSCTWKCMCKRQKYVLNYRSTFSLHLETNSAKLNRMVKYSEYSFDSSFKLRTLNMSEK